MKSCIELGKLKGTKVHQVCAWLELILSPRKVMSVSR